ncbi:MAG TPA: hypothetical protein DEG96_01165 [Candidatus Atribacteria bacterium]|nr:hypothetical protein [Candidatus Atribacteria bacterium]
MRKLIFYFVALVLILTLGSAGLAQGLPSLTESSPTPTPPTTNITPPPVSPSAIPETVFVPNIYSYSDPDCSFKFSYPETWEPYYEMDDTGTCKAEIDLFEGDYIIAAFSVYVENYDSSLASYAISVEEWMLDPKNMPEYNKINEEAITIGGLPAIKRLYTWTKIHKEDNSKIPIKAVDVYLVKDKKGYILEGQVVRDKFDQILPQLETMFNSFTVSERTTEPVPPVSDVTSVVTTTEAPSSSTTSSTTEEITIKFCPYCGTPLQPDYKFCPGCGKPIPVQRSIKVPKEIGVRNNNKININYSENLTQTRGFSEEINQFNYPRGINKSYSKPFKYFKPILISRGFGSKLVRLFPENPIFPWAVSKRIMLGNYANLFPASLGRKISSQSLAIRSFYPTNFNFSYIRGLGREIAFNPTTNSNISTTFRGRVIDQLGSPIKNLGEGTISQIKVSRAPLSEKTWILRNAKRGVEEDISIGSSLQKLSSKIGSFITSPQYRSSSFLGGCFSDIGKEVNPEIGVKREGEILPSLTPTTPSPTTPQTTTAIPGTTSPATGPEGIVSPAPGAPAQGGITLTPPGQPVPSQPGPGGIALPTPGTPQEPQIIWKQYSLNQAFSHNPLITGYLEYPSTWLVNLDSFNRNVTFSEDASGLTSLTLFPGLMGQFNSAQDLAQQMTYLLQQQVTDLSILNQEFKIVPTPGSGAIEVTEGKVNLQGSYQETIFRFNIETYVIYTGVYGPSSGMGYVILTQAPQNIFIEKEQKYFNRMILSYKRALGVVK